MLELPILWHRPQKSPKSTILVVRDLASQNPFGQNKRGTSTNVIIERLATELQLFRDIPFRRACLMELRANSEQNPPV